MDCPRSATIIQSLPSPAATGRSRRLDEVGAALGLDVGFRLDGATGPEGVQLLGAEQDGGGVEADGPDDRGLEASLGSALSEMMALSA